MPKTEKAPLPEFFTSPEWAAWCNVEGDEPRYKRQRGLGKLITKTARDVVRWMPANEERYTPAEVECIARRAMDTHANFSGPAEIVRTKVVRRLCECMQAFVMIHQMRAGHSPTGLRRLLR